MTRGRAGRACRWRRRGVQWRPPSFHARNDCARDMFCTSPTEELMAGFHPDTEVRGTIVGMNSPWSTARAERVLGLVPERPWRDGASAGR